MTEYKTSSSIFPIFLIGTLSMFFAEVFSGASVLWFIDIWGIFVTFPLYWGHTLFFFNVALRCRKLDFTSLYLLGVLFGLYESWITKVIWAGYFGQSPGWGTVAGFAIAELLVIVFFWHPIMSFIVPIFVFEVLSLSANSDVPVDDKILLEHATFLVRSKRNWLIALLITLMGAVFLSVNAGFNLIAAELTVLGSIAIIFVFYFLSKRKLGSRFSIYSLQLGKKGFVTVIVYLILLYAITFPLLLPERIPALSTMLLTIVFYIVIILLFYIHKPASDSTHSSFETSVDRSSLFTVKDLRNLFGLLVALILVMCILPVISVALMTVLYFGAIFLGVILIVTTSLRIIKEKL